MSVPPTFLSQLFIRKSAVFSGISLLIYDYLITFPLEAEYIWNAPWTAIKAGFLLNRYGNLVGQTFIMLEETGYLNHGSSKFCKIFGLYCSLFMVFSAESIRILVLMRAWAIWGCTYRVTVFLITLYIFYSIAVIATAIYPLTINGSIPHLYLDQVDICIVPIPPYIWLTWFATIGLDTIALVMVWYSLRKLCEESRGLYPSRLTHLLIRDALLFYASSLFNNVFTIVSWTVFSNDPRDFLQLALSFPLLSVVGQRLILNLRGFQAGPLTTRDISLEVDRQMANIGDRLWTNLGRDAEQMNSNQSENGKTSRTTETMDIELQPTVGWRDQGSPRIVHVFR